jgi:hypothetical protein
MTLRYEIREDVRRALAAGGKPASIASRFGLTLSAVREIAEAEAQRAAAYARECERHTAFCAKHGIVPRFTFE